MRLTHLPKALAGFHFKLYFLAKAGSSEAHERLDALLADPDPGLAALARTQLGALAER